MTRRDIIDKLESVERDVKAIREQLSMDKPKERTSVDYPLAIDSSFELGYTLEDLYKEFSKQKKHYATRLRHAFLEHHIETINDLMSLSLNDLLNMDGIGSETLRLLVKKLNSLGFDYYPVVKPK